MKKLLLCIVLLLCVTCVQAIAEKDGLYTYQINPDNTVTITDFDWKNNHGDIYIPEMLGNRMVSAIGEYAFCTMDNSAVKITLPDNIRSIGEYAFSGVSITYINIPLNTVEIGGGAFAECSVMRFNVAEGHTVFATIENALYNKQTKTLIAWPENKEISQIPNGIVAIGDYVFCGREFGGYKDVFELPSSIKTIGTHAFHKAANLVINASSVSVIDDYAFTWATVSFTTRLSLSRIGKHAFEDAIVDFEDGILSKTPYEIDDYAFNQANRIDGYTRLANVTSIGQRAFQKSTMDLDLNEPADLENLAYLGESAFKYAQICRYSYLENGSTVESHAYIYLTNDGIECVPTEAFLNTHITDLIVGPSVKEIGDSAFQGCEYLNHVELSDGLLTIGDKAFNGCAELTAISIPASVTMIGNDVFTGCAETLVVTVEAGSYGEVWTRTCGYAYVVNGQEEDLSWLD